MSTEKGQLVMYTNHKEVSVHVCYGSFTWYGVQYVCPGMVYSTYVCPGMVYSTYVCPDMMYSMCVLVGCTVCVSWYSVQYISVSWYGVQYMCVLVWCMHMFSLHTSLYVHVSRTHTVSMYI